MISGEQFQSLAEISFCSEKNCIINDQLKMMPHNVHLIGEFPKNEIKQYKRIFVYTHDMQLFLQHFFDHLSDGVTFITHNSDDCVDEKYLRFLDSPKIKKWFCQNRYIAHPKLFSIPIGLANSQWTHGNQSIIDQVKDDIIFGKLKHNRLVYKNFDISTNSVKRNYVNNVTNANGIYMDPSVPFKHYLESIAQSRYCIAPPGNGVDCHRIWECLYLGCVPIVEYHECFSQFRHLPILFVKNWEDVTIPALMHQHMGNGALVEETNLSYWKQKICTE